MGERLALFVWLGLLLLASHSLPARVECLEKGASLREFADEPASFQAAPDAASNQDGSWAQWWSYDGISGPDYWKMNKRWRLCSLGRRQSPIDLRTERLLYDHLLGPIRLNWLPAADMNPAAGENKLIKVQLLNSGRGVELWLEGGPGRAGSRPAEQLILSQGPLSYAYKLFKIELHSSGGPASGLANSLSAAAAAPGELGPSANSREEQEQGEPEEAVPEALRSGKSSEHLIDGRAFDAELQLHFYNRQLAGSAQEALRQAGAAEHESHLFAALSVFVVGPARANQTDQSEPDRQQQQLPAPAESPLDFLLDNLEFVQNQGDARELSLSREQLLALVPTTDQYITYQGSLNRPPCSEGVDWILVNRPLRVNLEKLRGLFEKLNTNQENIRPVKPLHRRLLRTTILNARDDCPSNPNNSNNKQDSSCNRKRAQLAQDNKQPADKCSMRPRYAYQLRYNLAGGPDGKWSL